MCRLADFETSGLHGLKDPFQISRDFHANLLLVPIAPYYHTPLFESLLEAALNVKQLLH